MQPPSKIDHLGIAVDSIEQAARFYGDALGLTSAGTEEVASQQVRVAFFQLGEVRIELLEPTAPDSPVARFLEKKGPGLHHIAYRVSDLPATLAALESAGVRLVDRVPRDGAHGMKIAFVHPASTAGVLTELCQSGP
jgi:methylmalonyl-CoA/ethylmalonyl-CoA epimerase